MSLFGLTDSTQTLVMCFIMKVFAISSLKKRFQKINCNFELHDSLDFHRKMLFEKPE